ncbi:MAG: DUF5131 family protein, partial [Spartobacteria bacterium]|nr:DUF5131 family protein [Spartobacteria bacterium]
SGPGARPMNPEWARSLRDQCVSSGTPFFFKQWGTAKQVRTNANYHGGDILDGRQWHQWPE